MARARLSSQTIKSLSSMPGPSSLPLFGSALLYRFGERSKTEYHLALLDMYRRYGPIVRENIGGTTIVHVFDPEDIKRAWKPDIFFDQAINIK